MIKYIFIILLLPSLAFGATETFYVCEGGDGTLPETAACATAYDVNDFNTVGNWDTDDQDDGLIGPNDDVVFMDDGGVFRPTGTSQNLNVKGSGLSGKPITLKRQSGDTPIISGSALVSTWSNVAGNIWSASLTNIPQDVYFDGTIGSEVADYASLDTDQEWYYCDGCGDGDDDTLYQHSTSDPDTRYTSPGTEAATCNKGISIDGYDYITVDGVTLQRTASHGIYITGDNIIIENCTINYSGRNNNGQGIYSHGSDNVIIRNNTVSYSGYNNISIDNTSSSGTIDNIVVEQNEVHHAEHHGINALTTTNDGDITNLIIRYNLIHTNGDGNDSGIYMQERLAANDIVSPIVMYNVSHSNTAHGIQINKYLGDEIDGALIYGNICYNNGTGSAGYGFIGDLTNSTIKNNILAFNNANDTDTEELRVDDGGGTANTSNYNLIYDDVHTDLVGWDGTTRTFADHQTNTSQDLNSVNSSPSFKNAPSDLSLSPQSPAIGSGTNLGATYDDCLDISSSWPSSVTTKDQDLYTPGWEIGAYCFPMQQGPGIGVIH
jgi:hypothetical protein